MDKIFLNHVVCSAIIGTLPEERLHRQKIIIDLELQLDLNRASVSDDLRDTVDYSAVERQCVSLAESSRFQLLEALAGAIGRTILNGTPVRSVRVRIEKPGGARFGRSVTVELEFQR